MPSAPPSSLLVGHDGTTSHSRNGGARVRDAAACSEEICGWVGLNRHVACHTHTTHVHNVALVGVIMGHSEWAWLCHLVPSLAGLRSLRLEDLGMDDTQFALLANTVLQHQQRPPIHCRDPEGRDVSLHTDASPCLLSVRGNALTARSMLPLGKLLLWWSASLHTVDASHNPIGDYGAQVLATILAKQNLAVMMSPEGRTLFPPAHRHRLRHHRSFNSGASLEEPRRGLSRLVLQHIRCSIRGIENLLVAASCMDWIHEVDLSENPASVRRSRSRTLRPVAAASTFTELRRNAPLRHVALQNAGIGHQLSPAGVEALLLSLWMSCPALESISLDNSHPPVVAGDDSVMRKIAAENGRDGAGVRDDPDVLSTRVGDALAVLVDQLVVSQEAQETLPPNEVPRGYRDPQSPERRIVCLAYPPSLESLRALSLQASGLTDEGARILVSAMARSSRVAARHREASSGCFVLCNLRCLNVDRNYVTCVGVLDLLDAMVHLHWERCARNKLTAETATVDHNENGDELDQFLFVLSAAMSVGVETMHDLDTVFNEACELLQSGGLLVEEPQHQRASQCGSASSNFYFSFGPYGTPTHHRAPSSAGKHSGSSLQERLEMGFTLQEYCEDIRGMAWMFQKSESPLGPRHGRCSSSGSGRTKAADSGGGTPGPMPPGSVSSPSALPPLSSAGSPGQAAGVAVGAGTSPSRVGDISSVTFSPPRSSFYDHHLSDNLHDHKVLSPLRQSHHHHHHADEAPSSLTHHDTATPGGTNTNNSSSTAVTPSIRGAQLPIGSQIGGGDAPDVSPAAPRGGGECDETANGIPSTQHLHVQSGSREHRDAVVPTPTSDVSDAPEPSPFVPHLHLHRTGVVGSDAPHTLRTVAHPDGLEQTGPVGLDLGDAQQSVMVITAADKATARKARLDANRKRRKRLLLSGTLDEDAEDAVTAAVTHGVEAGLAEATDAVGDSTRRSSRGGSGGVAGGSATKPVRAAAGSASWRHASPTAPLHPPNATTNSPATQESASGQDVPLSQAYAELVVVEVVECEAAVAEQQYQQQHLDGRTEGPHCIATPTSELLPDVLETSPPTRQTSLSEVAADLANSAITTNPTVAADHPVDTPDFELRRRILRDPSRLLGRFKTITLTYSHPPGHVLCRVWHLLSDSSHALHAECVDALQEDLLDILLPPDNDTAHSVESVQVAANDVAMTLDITFSTNEKRQTVVQRLQTGAAGGSLPLPITTTRAATEGPRMSVSEDQSRWFPRTCRLLLLRRQDIDIGARLDEHLRRAGSRVQLHQTFSSAWDVLHEFHGRTDELYAEVPELREGPAAAILVAQPTATVAAPPPKRDDPIKSEEEPLVVPDKPSTAADMTLQDGSLPTSERATLEVAQEMSPMHLAAAEVQSASSPRSARHEDAQRLSRIANDLPWALPGAAGSGSTLPSSELLPQRWIRCGASSAPSQLDAADDAAWVPSFLRSIVEGGGVTPSSVISTRTSDARDDSVARVLTVVFRDSENDDEDDETRRRQRNSHGAAQRVTKSSKASVEGHDHIDQADEPPPPPPPDTAGSALSPKRLTAPASTEGNPFGDMVDEEGDDDDDIDSAARTGDGGQTHRGENETFAEMASRRIASHKSLSFLRTPARHPSPSDQAQQRDHNSGPGGALLPSSALRSTVTFAAGTASSSSSSSPSAIRRSASHAELVHMLTHHPDGLAAVQRGLTVESVQRRIRNLERLCRESVAKGEISLSQSARNKVRVCQGLMHPIDPEVIHLGCLAFSPSAALPARGQPGRNDDKDASGSDIPRRTASSVSKIRVTLSVEWDGLLVLKEDHRFGGKSLLLVHPLGYGVQAHIEDGGGAGGSSHLVLRLQTLSNPAEEAEEEKLVANPMLRGKVSSAAAASGAVPSPSKSLFQTAMQQCDISIRVDSHKKAVRALTALAECTEKAKRMLLQKPSNATGNTKDMGN